MKKSQITTWLLVGLLLCSSALLGGCDMNLKAAGAEKNYDEACVGSFGIFNSSADEGGDTSSATDYNQGCIGPNGIINRPRHESSKEESIVVEESRQEESSMEESSVEESSMEESSEEESSEEESSMEESSEELVTGWVEKTIFVEEHTVQNVVSDEYTRYPALYYAVDNADMVKILQTKLVEMGYDLYIDGYYGDAVEEAVWDFQSKHGMLDSGSVCGNTWRALYSEWETVPAQEKTVMTYLDPETLELAGPGLVTIEGKEYYFNEDQELVTGPCEKAVDGIVYQIDEQGVAKEAMDDALWSAKAILDNIGYDLYEAYYWCSTMIEYQRRFEYYPYALTPDTIHTDFYALQSYDTHIGMCFNYAACFYQMARILGYEPTYIEGYVPIAGGELNHHAWVEIKDADGLYYVYDPTLAYESGSYDYCYHFEYGLEGTWIYCAFEYMQNENINFSVGMNQ